MKKKQSLMSFLGFLLCLAMTLPASAGGYVGEISQNGKTYNIATDGSGDGWSYSEFTNGRYRPVLTLNNFKADDLSLFLEEDVTLVLVDGSVNEVNSLSVEIYLSDGYDIPSLTVQGNGTLIIGGLQMVDYGGNEIENPLDFISVVDGATFTVTESATEEENATEEKWWDLDLPFTDVSEDAYYRDAVEWAIEKGITKGTSDTTFSPDAPCTRGQVATFLWRACNCPEPVTTENPFTDVSEASPFYKAILWAYEEEITAGTSATTFSPGNPCTYAHVITFLWRSVLKPEAVHSSALAESLPQGYYTPAVAWADSENMLSDAGEFNISAPCPRADIVTYLYRSPVIVTYQ